MKFWSYVTSYNKKTKAVFELQNTLISDVHTHSDTDLLTKLPQTFGLKCSTNNNPHPKLPKLNQKGMLNE